MESKVCNKCKIEKIKRESKIYIDENKQYFIEKWQDYYNKNKDLLNVNSKLWKEKKV